MTRSGETEPASWPWSRRGCTAGSSDGPPPGFGWRACPSRRITGNPANCLSVSQVTRQTSIQATRIGGSVRPWSGGRDRSLAQASCNERPPTVRFDTGPQCPACTATWRTAQTCTRRCSFTRSARGDRQHDESPPRRYWMKSNHARDLRATKSTAATARPLAAHATATRPPTSTSTAPRAERTARPRQLVLGVAISILIAVNAIGSGYYVSPMPIRVRHPMHEWLRPSGYIGQSAGILAFTIFVFLWLYPLRKKFKALAWTGSVGKWLDVHVTAALTLPLLLAIHAAWRFDGVIGLGYTAILLVCASGVVGRYLYSHIPRARSGVELSRDEVAAQRGGLVDRIAATTRLDRAVVEQTLALASPSARKLGVLRHNLRAGGRRLASVAADVARCGGDGPRWRPPVFAPRVAPWTMPCDSHRARCPSRSRCDCSMRRIASSAGGTSCIDPSRYRH